MSDAWLYTLLRAGLFSSAILLMLGSCNLGNHPLTFVTTFRPFAQVVLAGRLNSGETYQSQWRAPNTSARHPQIILEPGLYQAFILHREFFDAVKVEDTAPILFQIIQ